MLIALSCPDDSELKEMFSAGLNEEELRRANVASRKVTINVINVLQGKHVRY